MEAMAELATALWAARNADGALWLFMNEPTNLYEQKWWQSNCGSRYLQLPEEWLPDLMPGEKRHIELRTMTNGIGHLREQVAKLENERDALRAELASRPAVLPDEVRETMARLINQMNVTGGWKITVDHLQSLLAKYAAGVPQAVAAGTQPVSEPVAWVARDRDPICYESACLYESEPFEEDGQWMKSSGEFRQAAFFNSMVKPGECRGIILTEPIAPPQPADLSEAAAAMKTVSDSLDKINKLAEQAGVPIPKSAAQTAREQFEKRHPACKHMVTCPAERMSSELVKACFSELFRTVGGISARLAEQAVSEGSVK